LVERLSMYDLRAVLKTDEEATSKLVERP
jgi:hypothetical protein